MAKKKLKKIIGAIGAGLAAHAMSKAGASGSKAIRSKYFGGLDTGDAKVAENLAIWDKGMDKMGKGFDKGNVHQHTPWYKKWWNMKMKNSGGPIKAYQGQLVKSQTRGTGAAVKGTTHEIMPGMDAAKHGKMIKAKKGQGYFDKEDESIGMRLGKGKATKKNEKKAKKERDMSYGDWGKRGKDWKVKKARHGTMVRTRGSNPDNPYVMQGGEVGIQTKLNGVVKTRTW